MNRISRRTALQLLGGAASGMAWRGFGQSTGGIEVSPGRFANTRTSLKGYAIPEWFPDAKFGIWSHWGPQSAVGDGDWYARNMYMEGSKQYEYHVKRFGHPSKVGYKDLVPLFTANRWDPEHLMDLYQKAGAKYFFSMGVHHDNFDMWNSKYQPRWNAVTMGPKKDVVGMWAAAARRRGMRFGVSEHLSNSFDWLAPAHLSDTKGPLAGVPYDGTDAGYADLYHDYAGMPVDFAKTAKAMGRTSPDRWKLQYFRRVKDLVDQHQPDMLYTDGHIPLEEYGLGTVAEEYNAGPKSYNGAAEGVYFSKRIEDCAVGTCVLDRERGVSDAIWPSPWQTDTCIGQWHYNEGERYKTPKKVIDLLVDIVSKNGNLLLNFPLPASGELDADEMRVLEGITTWTSANGEGIYGTRPWGVHGEGPGMKVAAPDQGFNEGKQPDLGAQDFRFTSKGERLYCFVQGWPQGDVVVKALGTGSPQKPGKVARVQMLGRQGSLQFTQETSGLKVTLQGDKPAWGDMGVALRVNFV